MTAPDVNADVRARFEAWFAKACPTTDAQAREGIIGATTCRNFAFKAWQAAHADLSGEVRELVEAADSSGEYLDAYFKASYSSQPADWMDAALLAKQWHCRIEAALAKHTHQEKNDVLP